MWPTSLALRALVIVALLGSVLACGVGAGVHYRGLVADRDLSSLKAAYDARVNAAELAKEAAEARATATEHATTLALAAADSKHQQEITNERSKNAAAVAAYRDGSARLRYLIPDDASRGGAVPGAAAPAGGGDGPATGELPRSIAGDLLTLVGDADEVVVQLHFAQSTIDAYYAACGPAPAAPDVGH